MRWLSRTVYVALFLTTLHLFAEPQTLTKKDVRTTMEEMFSYHVEHKRLTPLIVKRSFKLYIEQFDADRIYLLQSEVKPFLELGEAKIASIIEKYHEDDFSEYEALDRLMAKAIERSRKLRTEVVKEVLEPSASSPNPSYAANVTELKIRLKKQFAGFLASENTRGGSITPEKQVKIANLWEKRLQRSENPFLSLKGRGEHFLALHILKSMAKSLDPHTSYFSPEEAFELRTSLEKQFEGIGIVLRETVDGIMITGFIKGGPAEKSGKIATGDFLASINRKPLQGVAYEEVLMLLKGDSGQSIALGLNRFTAGADRPIPIHVELVREKITMEDERVQYSVFPFADGIIGKLDLPSFYESGDGSSCERDLRDAIKELKKQGKLLGLVMDMRENGGGFLNQAVKVAGLFITSGIVVISKYSEGEVQYLRDVDGRVYYSGPMLILTSKISASAAEIVAQALQDYGTALIVGDERTYGKGSIQYQTVTDENANSFFKVTVGKYYTVSGKSTQIEGVKADIVVPSPYSVYRIGERFLEYPLPNDRMPPAYSDPLVDLDGRTKQWFQKNYLPYLHKKDNYWRKMLPTLSENSAFRLERSKDFSLYMKTLEKSTLTSGPENWGVDDLAMQEAMHIVQDMIILQADHPLLSR